MLPKQSYGRAYFHKWQGKGFQILDALEHQCQGPINSYLRGERKYWLEAGIEHRYPSYTNY